MEPPLGIAPGWLAYRASASLAMLWGRKKCGVGNRECGTKEFAVTILRFSTPHSSLPTLHLDGWYARPVTLRNPALI